MVALRITRDLIVELRIKLNSIGVYLIGPTDFYCDNQGVAKNTSVPKSTSNKKHKFINYHDVKRQYPESHALERKILSLTWMTC